MKVNQQLVNKILDRARQSSYGLGEPETGVNIEHYTQDVEGLAIMLVSAFHSKYDLVSVFKATMEVLNEQ